MNGISQKILSQYQVRKTKKQKREFEDFLRDSLARDGIELKIEEKGGNRNLIVGDPDSAEVVFTAHYDTQPVLPFPNIVTPKNIPFFILYQIAISVLLFGPGLLIEFGLIYLGCSFYVCLAALYCWIIGMLLLMFIGPANKHTANDNTSGVITVLETVYLMRERGTLDDAAFVLFDNEEKGMLGSAAFASLHKKSLRGLIVNFDCVSDGDSILLFPSRRVKKDSAVCARLEAAFKSSGDKELLLEKGAAIYPSDQMSFKRSVGVASFNKKPVLGYYTDKLHTAKDTVFDERNIALLSECAANFARSSDKEKGDAALSPHTAESV